jgi:hypothetical protein
VHVIFGECVRQCVAPSAETRYRGLMLSQSPSQGLPPQRAQERRVLGTPVPPWANFCRPSGFGYPGASPRSNVPLLGAGSLEYRRTTYGLDRGVPPLAYTISPREVQNDGPALQSSCCYRR